MLTLTEVERGMVDFQHLMNVVQRILETVRRTVGLSQIQLAFTYHLCNIMQTGEIVLTGLFQLFVKDLHLAHRQVVAFHVTQQTEIIFARIVVTLEIALVVQCTHIDIGQLVIQVHRPAIVSALVICNGAIENTPHPRQFASLLHTVDDSKDAWHVARIENREDY